MKKIATFTLFLISGVAFSQQEAQFISAFNNPAIYNPAAGGMTSTVQIDLISRLQWVGFGGGPTTFNINANGIIGSNHSTSLQEIEGDNKFLSARPNVTVGALKHVVGGQVYTDKIGAFQSTNIVGNYAIHLPVTKEFNIGAGLAIGWQNDRINTNKAVLYNTDDELYLTALANTAQQNSFRSNVGITFYGKGLFFGAGFSNLANTKARFNNVGLKGKFQSHFYTQVSYAIQFGKHAVEPAVILKATAKAPVNLDFGVRYIYNNALWAGVYGRTGNAIAAQLGANLVKNLYVSYVFDYSIGKIRNSKGSSHEIQLGIYIGKPKAKQKTDTQTNKESE